MTSQYLVLEDSKIIGAVQTMIDGVAYDFSTQDEDLEAVLSWCAVNPVPLMGPKVVGGVYASVLTGLSIGDPLFGQAVREFLEQDYGYETKNVSETTLKGGPGSGYHGHAGRPGRRGGSSPSAGLSAENAKMEIAGKTGREWHRAQLAVSERAKLQVLSQFDREGPATEVSREQLVNYLDRLGDHRTFVLDETLNVAKKRAGVMPEREKSALMGNLVQHDRDKYDFKVAEAYVGSFQLDRKTYEGSFTAAMNAHHLSNPHHYEYWTEPGGKRAKPMPRLHFVEMMGDWNGTAREKGTPKDGYYKKYGKYMTLHPETRAAAERELGIKRGRRKDVVEVIQAFKGGPGSGHYGHAGVPGKVGGSSSIAVGGAEAAKRGLPAGGDYELVGTYGNINGAKRKLEKTGPGHVLVRVNGKYHVVKTEFVSAPAPTPPPRAKVKPPDTAYAEGLYEAASPRVKALAEEVGVVAVGPQAEKYVNEVLRPASISGHVFRPNEMIALKSPETKERQAVLSKYLKNWDRVEHGSFRGQVTGIFAVVHNKKTMDDWSKHSTKKDNTKTGLYHGTDMKAAISIAQGGYRVGAVKEGRMLGHGLYLTDKSSKSVQYVGARFSRRGRARGVVFENKVSLGNMVKTTTEPTGLLRAGKIRADVDAIYAPKGSTAYTFGRPLRNSEIAVKAPKAALPAYWLDVHRMPAEERL